jgi:hypothetical protein
MDKIRKKIYILGFLAMVIAILTITGIGFAQAQDQTFQSIVGKWVRPDGGYMLEVKSVGADGKMDAAYYNPSPIHVAIAEVSLDGEKLKVFVELRDVNYPGSNYHLVYDAKRDQLQGDYYQAVAKEYYPIFFERVKEN